MIKQFQGSYRWLSNFTLVDIEFDKIIYPSVEHAYMSAKSNDANWKKRCSNRNTTPGEIKRASRNIILVDNWNSYKLEVMKICLEKKFYQEPFRTLLIETENQILQEGNTWGDKFWGVDLRTGEGENNLGKLIMNIREILL